MQDSGHTMQDTSHRISDRSLYHILKQIHSSDDWVLLPLFILSMPESCNRIPVFSKK